MGSEFFQINDVGYCVHTFRSRSHEEKRSIFALHGFTGSGLDYLPIAHRLPFLDWYAPDFLGHGHSYSPWGEDYYSLENVLNTLVTLLDRLSLKKSILLGYSMGGRIALHLALHYPELFNTVILIGASPGVESSVEAQRRVKDDNNLAERISRLGIRAFNQEWINNPIIATQINIPQEIREPMQLRREGNNALGLANCLKKLGLGILPSLWVELRSLQVPVFLVTGKNDPKFSGIAREMSLRLPLSTRIEIPAAGHAAHLENMPFFVALLKSIVFST